MGPPRKWVRGHGSILLAAALGFTLLVGVASPASGSLSGPLLTVGDSWTYRTNTSIGGAFFLGGDVTVTTTGKGLQSVDGIMYDAVRFSLSGAGTANGTVASQFGPTRASGNWVLSGSEVFESAGLKLVSSVLDLEASGTLHTAPVAFPFQLSVQNTTTFRIVEDSWRFPLGIGNSSVVASRMNFSEDSRFFYGLQTTPSHTQGSLWWNVTYALETPVAVDTPAGGRPRRTRDRASRETDYFKSSRSVGRSSSEMVIVWREVFGGNRSPVRPRRITSSFVTTETTASGHMPSWTMSEK